MTSPGRQPWLVETVLEHGGGFDVLVNNAGTPGSVRAEDASLRPRPRRQSRRSSFHLARLLAQVRSARTKSVVNVSSVLGLVSGAPLGVRPTPHPRPGSSDWVAGQWGGSGTRVNALAPGWFRSEMTEGLFADERSRRWVERGTMLGRGGEAGELDGALLFLASHASSYCTGQVLTVDGGVDGTMRVTTEVDSDAVAHVEMCRGDGNAIDLAMARGLLDAARSCETARARAVLLTGRAWSFCVGGDLREFATVPRTGLPGISRTSPTPCTARCGSSPGSTRRWWWPCRALSPGPDWG